MQFISAAPKRLILNRVKNDKSIVIKDAVRVRRSKQLGDKEVFVVVSNDPAPLLKTIYAIIAKIRNRGGLKSDTLDHFIMKDPKLKRFYFLPKNHKGYTMNQVDR